MHKQTYKKKLNTKEITNPNVFQILKRGKFTVFNSLFQAFFDLFLQVSTSQKLVQICTLVVLIYQDFRKLQYRVKKVCNVVAFRLEFQQFFPITRFFFSHSTYVNYCLFNFGLNRMLQRVFCLPPKVTQNTRFNLLIRHVMILA